MRFRYQALARAAGRILSAAALAWPATLLPAVAQGADMEVTGSADSGQGTLREAITTANGNGQADLVTFADDITTITLESQLTIETDPNEVIIRGGLDGNGEPTVKIEQTVEGERVFEITDGALATFDGLIITGGTSSSRDASGIYNFATLTIIDSKVIGNAIIGSGNGGGIWNDGALTVAGSTVSANIAGTDGGGIFNNHDAMLDVRGSVISGNSAAGGGGIHNRGTMKVDASTISGNVAGSDFGGGIEGFGDDGIPARITRSLIINNSTLSSAGGGIHAERPMQVVNSTIVGNLARSGGGFFSHAENNHIVHTTITGNGASDAGGGIFSAEPVTFLKSSIIAGNLEGGDCGSNDPANFLASAGFNIDGDGSCALDQPTDLPNTDPLLGLLMDNGGPTETMALSDGSPALDAVPLLDCVELDGTRVTFDQRGMERPQPFAGSCDVGAFERAQQRDLTIEIILALFDYLAENGAIVGTGPAASAPNRLGALRSMLVATGELVDQGAIDDACGGLLQVARRVDNEEPPQDFTGGAWIDVLADAVSMFRQELGCVA